MTLLVDELANELREYRDSNMASGALAEHILAIPRIHDALAATAYNPNEDYGIWADSTAMDMRAYFEANRPLTFWEKLFGRREYVESCVADNLMLGLIDVVIRARATLSSNARHD